MRSWSIPIGRLFGIDVRLHLTFFLLLLFVWVTESAVPHGPGAGHAFALAGILLGAVVLHEAGHAFMAAHTGVPVRSVILLPIGGITLLDEPTQSAPDPYRDMRIALTGPFVNLAVAFVAGLIVFFVAPETNLLKRPLLYSGGLVRSLFWGNVFLAGINLLPAYPMDGGRVLRAIFMRRLDPARATRRAVAVGQAFAMLFIFAGIWNTWLMLTGFFLFVAAQLEERSAVFQSVLESVRMEDVMLTDFCTLSPADTLEDALHKAVHSLQDDFPVIRGSEMVGIISRQRILESLRSQGNAYVQSVMNQAFDASRRHDSLASAFRKITGRGMTLIPVVDNERLVGIVTLQNLMHSMSLLAESRKLRRKEPTP
ncbi:MAG: site-2 protease family protein [Terriglobales bacterium]